MQHSTNEPSPPLTATAFEIVFLVLTIVAAALFWRFGGPLDTWVLEGKLSDNQIVALMLFAWLFLVLGIVVRKPKFRYPLLTVWVILASLMRVYQDLHPIINLAAALCILVGLTILNRVMMKRARSKKLTD